MFLKKNRADDELPALSGDRFIPGRTPLASTMSLKCPAPFLLMPLMLKKYACSGWRSGISYDVTLAGRRADLRHS